MGQKNTTVQFRKEIVKQEESLCYSTYAGDESEIDYLTDVNDYYGNETGVQTRQVKTFSNLNFSLDKQHLIGDKDDPNQG